MWFQSNQRYVVVDIKSLFNHRHMDDSAPKFKYWRISIRQDIRGSYYDCSHHLWRQGVLTSKRLGSVDQLKLAVKNSPPLGEGSKGLGVAVLQDLLNDLGYVLKLTFKKGSPDGIYGSETEAAVKQYQKKYALAADGIAGTKTLLSLDKLIKERPFYETPDTAKIAHQNTVDGTKHLTFRTKAIW